jgi:flagellar hook-associated protein 1
MSLGNAIGAALSGLQLTQTGVGLIADNIANAETPGYVRKSLLQQTTSSSGGGAGVRVVGIQRELDVFVQRQLRAELAGSSYINSISTYYNRIDQIYGSPGGLNALDTLFNNFGNSLQSLATSPESISNRSQVLNEAQVLAQHLNSMSRDVQELRTQAELAISADVTRINQILQNIENVSLRIISADQNSGSTAALYDQRDLLIGELSGLIDVRTVETGPGQVAIFTTSGISLFDHKASLLSFDGRDGVSAQAMWDADPTKRGVGTITLTTSDGFAVDLIANKSIRSGDLASHLQMRDVTLVEAQAQLDEIAHALATALSNRTVAGQAATSGAQTGFSVDLSALQNGNTINLTYTDAGGTHKISIVRVNDPDALPLTNAHTADTTDTVIGVDWSGGMAGVLAQLNTALGPNIQFDNPSGNLLRVLDDGAGNLADINSLSATVTTSGFQSGDPSLPFFVDGSNNTLYTNYAMDGMTQKLGFAARIAVNLQLKDDPSRLVVFDSDTMSGDPTRPDWLEQQLTSATRAFAPETGIGTKSGAYSGTLVDYIRQVISLQGGNADNAYRLKEGQDIVVNALQARFSDRSSVNIDSEMANLLILQTAYGANARVMTAVKEMLDALIRM